jgi:hypothetical protein
MRRSHPRKEQGMTPDEIAALVHDTAGAHWGDRAHFQRFAAAFEKRFSAASMPAIKLAMEAERQNGAIAEREACAQVCEALRPSKREFDKRYYDAYTACAQVIRGRSNP